MVSAKKDTDGEEQDVDLLVTTLQPIMNTPEQLNMSTARLNSTSYFQRSGPLNGSLSHRAVLRKRSRLSSLDKPQFLAMADMPEPASLLVENATS